MSLRPPPFLPVAVGYFVAVIVAVVVTVFLIIGTPFFESEVGVVTWPDVSRQLPSLVTIGMAWTFPCAFPGFLLAVLLGERLKWNSWRPYAIAGFGNAAPALAIFSVLFGSPSDLTAMTVSSFPGGFAGGLAYWFASGRYVASRRA
ncbi:hypothetical protein [Tianweitania sp.]|uniref:hypothetical protein n=1 Tax=Tianweitania sp. TaxID=2021634 RepID=UPI00289F4AA4|nr:hypothetical protein [Tianweitania sp.]